MNGGDEPLDWLIAHRGWPEQYPENSLSGVKAVLEAGARMVEFDVQLTADHYPVAIHDDNLRRLAGIGENVTELRLDELDEITIGPEGSRTSRIATLEQMLAQFDDYPGATAFVELKRHSVRRFGSQAAVAAVMERLRLARCQCVFLSFHAGAVREARRCGATAVGWAFRPWSIIAWWRASRLAPDYLFIRSDRVPGRERPFWPGDWRWVVYRVDDLETAQRFRRRGADFIEVDNLPDLVR